MAVEQLKPAEALAAGGDAAAGDWHKALFRKSVLKQRKLRELRAALGEVSDGVYLDLGSDNGVISFYLRELGGTWHSADMTTQAVESIRSLVADRVSQTDGHQLPYPDAEFDAVVIVDMLEHVEDDRRFVTELARVLKPGGVLIVNTPNLKLSSPLRMFRHLIGQTDEAHGHLRPGYGPAELEQVLAPDFSIERQHTYSRFFSELIDTMIVAAYTLLSGSSHGESEGQVSKGLVVTEQEMKKFQKKFKLYSAIYPIVWAVSRLDYAISFIPGFMRIARARRR